MKLLFSSYYCYFSNLVLCSLFLFSLQRKKKFNAFNEKFVMMNENFFIEEEIMKTREYKKVETRMQEWNN
jgi:hypothetical protein